MRFFSCSVLSSHRLDPLRFTLDIQATDMPNGIHLFIPSMLKVYFVVRTWSAVKSVLKKVHCSISSASDGVIHWLIHLYIAAILALSNTSPHLTQHYLCEKLYLAFPQIGQALPTSWLQITFFVVIKHLQCWLLDLFAQVINDCCQMQIRPAMQSRMHHYHVGISTDTE